MLWEELREEEFDSAIKESGGVCVIPMGCSEMHGQHLPVFTDNMEAEAIAKAAAKIEPVCIFPTYRFGDVTDLVEWKGSIRLDPHLMLYLLENLCDEIARNGFKKILLVNCHGGNTHLMNYFLRSIHNKKRDYVVMGRGAFSGTDPVRLWKRIQEEGADKFPELFPEDLETLRKQAEEHLEDGHGGLDETSVMMNIRPDLVRLDRLGLVSGLNTHVADELTNVGMSAQPIWKMNYPNSYAGADPVGASDRIGKALMRVRVEKLAEAYKVYKKSNILEWNEKCNSYYPD